MRLPRAFALAFSLLVCYAIDLTRAMEMLHNVPEGTEVTRVHVTSEAKLFDHPSMDHVACLKRRGLVAGRLRLMRRCQTPESHDLGPNHGPERQSVSENPRVDKSPKVSLKNKKVDPGFENGITRWGRKLKETWANMRRLSSRSWRNKVDPSDGEKAVIAKRKKPQIYSELRKTLWRKFRSGTGSGLKKSWKYLFSNWAEGGVNTLTRAHARLPRWAVKRFTETWDEMQKPGIEMQARIESMKLDTLYTQMITSGSSEIAAMGYKLPQPQEAQNVVTWAYFALLNAPSSKEAMTDGLREKLMISVKVLYIHAIDTQPSWGQILARTYFRTLDDKYATSAAHADPGIATYIHEAYIAFLNKKVGPQTEEEIKKDNALKDILMRTKSRDLAAELEHYVNNGIMKHPENRGQVINLAMTSILKETDKMEEKDYALFPERSEQLEKYADWAIRTLFQFARSGYPEAEHHLSVLWTYWLRNKPSRLADVVGKKLKAAYDLLILKHIAA